MKIKPECIPCLIDRAKLECDLAFEKEDDKVPALSEILCYIGGHLDSETVPAELGVARDRIIKRRSGNSDPYRELKRESNQVALELLSIAEEFYEKASDKLGALVRIAAASNSMEYGVRGHEFNNEDFKGEFSTVLEEELVGDLRAIERALKRSDKILYLNDNAGEALFDRFVGERLVEMGKEVVFSPKSGPIINDATVEDLKELDFNAFAIVPNGTYVGISLDEAPEDFLDLLWNEDYLIIAKGMGNYETITEFESRLKGRLIYVFRAKCNSVAGNAGVERGQLVARLVE